MEFPIAAPAPEEHSLQLCLEATGGTLADRIRSNIGQGMPRALKHGERRCVAGLPGRRLPQTNELSQAICVLRRALMARITFLGVQSSQRCRIPLRIDRPSRPEEESLNTNPWMPSR